MVVVVFEWGFCPYLNRMVFIIADSPLRRKALHMHIGNVIIYNCGVSVGKKIDTHLYGSRAVQTCYFQAGKDTEPGSKGKEPEARGSKKIHALKIIRINKQEERGASTGPRKNLHAAASGFPVWEKALISLQHRKYA